jgi:nucleotide-binding universal stress UspA family protein
VQAPLVLAYDGSDAASRAIETAGAVFGGGPALVVFVWRPLSTMMLWNPVLGGPGPLKDAADEIDASGAEHAAQVAAEGVEKARRAGFEAEPVVARDDGGWGPIVELARERDARAIVLGSHGTSAIRSLVLGSVAAGVVNHATRPVMVVPAEQRESRPAGSG